MRPGCVSPILLVNNNGVIGEWQLNGGGNVGAIGPTWHI
jgi:hypothetical protein